MKILQLLQNLFESPVDIESLDYHDLNNPIANTNEYNKRLTNKYQYKKKILQLTPTATIYQFKREFFCLDQELERITYYMTYEVARNRILGDYVWQSLVWRYQPLAQTYLKEIPQKVFWEFLYGKYNTIITDSEQTWNGRSFWEARIAEALQQNINVYYFDFANNNLQKLEHFDDLRIFQTKYNIWGILPANKLRRMVITKNILLH